MIETRKRDTRKERWRSCDFDVENVYYQGKSENNLIYYINKSGEF